MKPPWPVMPSAIGVSAKIVASAVMRIGRRRRAPPATVASWAVRPFVRYWFTRSTRTIAFVTTMPISISTPMSEATPSGTPVMICSRIAPVAANGTEIEQQQRLAQRLEGRDHHDVDDQDRREQRESELRERVRLLRDDAAERRRRPTAGRSASSSAVVTEAEAACRLSVDGVDGDGRGALAALGRDRGRALALLDGRDLRERDRAGRATGR